MVRCTGTFVNRDSTSKENKSPECALQVNISTNSVEDFNILPWGKYFLMSLSISFAVWYVGVVTWEIIGRSFDPGL